MCWHILPDPLFLASVAASYPAIQELQSLEPPDAEEFQSASQQVSDAEVIEAAKRGLERSVAIVHAEMKRGLSALATIGSTAPFVGLFGTVVGILNAFKGIANNKATGLSAVAGGIAEALVTTAFGLLVAVPAVWAYNYFTNKVEAFDVEMDNSSMELINYFILRRGAKK